MAVTRTTGGAGNDEDAGNGDVCVYAYVRVCLRVCVHVHLCVDTRAARLVRPPIPGLPGTRATATAARTESKDGRMASLHTVVCATQE